MKNLKVLALALFLPSMSGFANTCENLRFEAEDLVAQIESFQADLHDAAPSSKSFYAAQIRSLSAQLARVRNQLRQQNCG
ncbi:MAG: hypothetical protein M3Q07_16030 [Pseudobdellovibrionaceae bacterium]|nr:hypothetical protein [Pseudobdellovibrionaceae bacterium]